MAKTYYVHLGGQARALKYTLADREWVESQFPRADGTPASLGALVRSHLVDAGSIKVQSTILAAGLRHLGDEWTPDRVRTELGKEDALTKGILKSYLVPAFHSILASGVMGTIIENPEGEDVEGKAATPAG